MDDFQTMNEFLASEMHRALKFGLFLDSLCAGVSAMPQAARSGGLRPEPISVVSALRAPAAIARDAQ